MNVHISVEIMFFEMMIIGSAYFMSKRTKRLLFPLILDGAIVEPPPPKKSCLSTLPPPAISSGYNSVSSGYNSAPTFSLKECQCLCLEETNRLRAQLGLKPLLFEDIPEFREGGRKEKRSPEGRWY
jgi:hypothetical protein